MTTQTQTYRVQMRDDSYARETEMIEAADLTSAVEAAESAARSWAREGDWGDAGAVVEVSWTLIDADGDEVDSGDVSVTIEPNHDALIRAAGGDPNCLHGEHDWTSEGEGGCDENPGVWSVGGTALVFRSHCRRCGLQRVERTTGSQRNPGEHDTVEYEQPASWCSECERVECECEPDPLDALKKAVRDCRTLDELESVLVDHDGANVLGTRPEDEDSIMWMPVFSSESKGDGGEGWEIISWDEDRLMVLRKDYSNDDYGIEIVTEASGEDGE